MIGNYPVSDRKLPISQSPGSSIIIIIIISVALLEELNEIRRHRVAHWRTTGPLSLILLSGHPARRRVGEVKGYSNTLTTQGVSAGQCLSLSYSRQGGAWRGP